MRILLDTDICIYAINRKRPEALSRVRGYPIGEVGISAITCAELRFGVENSARAEENMERLALPIAAGDRLVRCGSGATLRPAGTRAHSRRLPDRFE